MKEVRVAVRGSSFFAGLRAIAIPNQGTVPSGVLNGRPRRSVEAEHLADPGARRVISLRMNVARQPSAYLVIETSQPRRSIASTTTPRPRQESSYRRSGVTSGGCWLSWRKPRAATSTARRRFSSTTGSAAAGPARPGPTRAPLSPMAKPQRPTVSR